MTRSLAIGVGALGILIGLIAGRWLAPTKVREVEAKVRDDSEKHAATAKAETTKDARDWMWAGPVEETHRRFAPPTPGQPCPAPVLAEETTIKRGPVVSGSEAKATTSSTKAEASEKRNVEIQYKERLVERSAPRWAAGAALGLGLDGSRQWGGYARMRVVGPIEVGVVAVPSSRAVVGTLGVQW